MRSWNSESFIRRGALLALKERLRFRLRHCCLPVANRREEGFGSTRLRSRADRGCVWVNVLPAEATAEPREPPGGSGGFLSGYTVWLGSSTA